MSLHALGFLLFSPSFHSPYSSFVLPGSGFSFLPPCTHSHFILCQNLDMTSISAITQSRLLGVASLFRDKTPAPSWIFHRLLTLNLSKMEPRTFLSNPDPLPHLHSPVPELKSVICDLTHFPSQQSLKPVGSISLVVLFPSSLSEPFLLLLLLSPLSGS